MSTTPRTKERSLKRSAKKLALLLMLLMVTVVSVTSGAYNTQAAKAEEEAPMDTRKGRTVMYIMDSHDLKLRDEDAHALDQMNYSFALIRDGKADGSHWRGLKKVQAFLKRNPHVDGVLSIGGWGADGFSDACLTEEGRKASLDRAYADELWSVDGFISQQAVDTCMKVVTVSGLWEGEWNYEDMVDMRFVQQ